MEEGESADLGLIHKKDLRLAAVQWHSFEQAAVGAAWVAAQLRDSIATAILARGGALLALCGGRTPRQVYALLAAGAPLLHADQLTVVPTDERFIAVDHEYSNERMLRELLLTGALRETQLLSLMTPHLDLERAAQAANSRVQALQQPFDRVLLGMGEDGHMASLFPGAAGVGDAIDPATADSVVAIVPTTHAPSPLVPRLSLTLPRLLWSRGITLLISGQSKRELLQRAIDYPDAERWPVSALFQHAAAPIDVVCFV